MIFASSFPLVFGDDEASDHPEAVAALAQLLPPGKVWDLSPGTVLRATLLAVSDEFERVRYRGLDLIEESDPRTATETLPDWERMVGLPDAQVETIPSDLPSRRVAVTQKFTAVGGQNLAFWQTLCSSCGYPLVSLGTVPVCRVGSRVGVRVSGSAWAYTMTITVSAGASGALSHAQFVRVIRAHVHAHVWANVTFL